MRIHLFRLISLFPIGYTCHLGIHFILAFHFSSTLDVGFLLSCFLVCGTCCINRPPFGWARGIRVFTYKKCKVCYFLCNRFLFICTVLILWLVVSLPCVSVYCSSLLYFHVMLWTFNRMALRWTIQTTMCVWYECTKFIDAVDTLTCWYSQFHMYLQSFIALVDFHLFTYNQYFWWYFVNCCLSNSYIGADKSSYWLFLTCLLYTSSILICLLCWCLNIPIPGCQVIACLKNIGL